ncbi:hypothetical protein JJD41_15905 [Oxynema sp. CENA135]|uniref:hypothetical protein n=1 Tax=Oxynema sp. CENA135 TaxID=984206 RepID=UPI00190E2D7B|nr:hypothetical protein [Oxynema sp. CENA135]MBK4731334.1 hypothetical protein [Oxynema sp. CENA135]
MLDLLLLDILVLVGLFALIGRSDRQHSTSRKVRQPGSSWSDRDRSDHGESPFILQKKAARKASKRIQIEPMSKPAVWPSVTLK